MNQRTLWILLIIVVIIIFGFLIYRSNSSDNISTSNADIVDAVEGFGSKLKNVSLLATSSQVSREMDENYTTYVSPQLISEWKEDPMHAPGRLTSSPFPDRIEVTGTQENSDGTYTVSGNVVETTNGGDGATTTGSVTGTGTYPIIIRLEKQNGNWVIIEFHGYNSN